MASNIHTALDSLWAFSTYYFMHLHNKPASQGPYSKPKAPTPSSNHTVLKCMVTILFLALGFVLSVAHHKIFIPDPFPVTHVDAVSSEVEWVMKAKASSSGCLHEAGYHLLVSIPLWQSSITSFQKYLLIQDSHQLISSFLALKSWSSCSLLWQHVW